MMWVFFFLKVNVIRVVVRVMIIIIIGNNNIIIIVIIIGCLFFVIKVLCWVGYILFNFYNELGGR